MRAKACHSGPPSGSIHCLLIEDNSLDAELIERELRHSGLECTFTVVQTPEDFTREMRAHCPDIVLADYKLPHWSGMDALEILMRECPKLPLILVSGSLGEETAVDCIKRGATDYVLKSGLARLPVAIGRALQERQARERRELAEELFRRAVECSPSGILMADEAGKILLANPQAEKLFCYKGDEMVGQSIEMLLPERIRHLYRQHRAADQQDSAKIGLGDGGDLYGLRKDGAEFPAEIELNGVQTSTGTLTLIVVVDITARRQAERKAQEYTEELKRSNGELEQFAYVASHDLQEPLRMVASYTELLAERYRGKLDEKADKYIGYAVDGAQHMQRLINDLLVYARVSSQAKALQPTDSGTVLAAVVRQLHEMIDKNKAEIIQEKLPVINADELQLGQVFQNLIGNAVKFHDGKPPRIQVAAKPAGDMWEFSVADNGIGIAEESRGRIFQMFQRLHTRQEFEGTGIGLAITKRIVERHGGKIWFDSVLDQGTTFHFTMPK
ncbi:MAG: ATP-binding protein, partial [Candidatus Sulfotelmatobacter sp.]